jgi:hypothetical protein
MTQLTQSVWGEPPERFYKWVQQVESSCSGKLEICVVGCADGKFVLPFARRGHRVTAIDLDIIALEGGQKRFPVQRQIVDPIPYVSIEESRAIPLLPSTERAILGLRQRLIAENLTNTVVIKYCDFYREPIAETFQLVFTSCSIQYKTNRDISPFDMIDSLCRRVTIGGYLAMEYMLPLEDSHHWKAPHFLRSGQVEKMFDHNRWDIKELHEDKSPVFEEAHVDRPQDHFHRFGYVLAEKRCKDV